MADDLQLNVNLANPQDIADKLPHAQMILEAKRRAKNTAAKEYEDWAALVRRLQAVAGVDPDADGGSDTTPGGARRKAAPVQDFAVKIVEREGRPMRPPEVAGMMRSEGFPVKTDNAVNSALYAAAQSGRLLRPRKGWYAPLDHGDGRDSQELLASASEAQE